jgi:hypothetical protein
MNPRPPGKKQAQGAQPGAIACPRQPLGQWQLEDGATVRTQTGWTLMLRHFNRFRHKLEDLVPNRIDSRADARCIDRMEAMRTLRWEMFLRVIRVLDPLTEVTLMSRLSALSPWLSPELPRRGQTAVCIMDFAGFPARVSSGHHVSSVDGGRFR